jgi:hypothetical protein
VFTAGGFDAVTILDQQQSADAFTGTGLSLR